MTTAAVIDLVSGTSQGTALRGIRVSSVLTAMGQRTTIEQSFVNIEEEAIEATYTFPVPEKAAVCGFEVNTGERVLTGQVEDAQKADDLYEAAIRSGDAAYALRQHRPDVFSVDVGNIKPGQAVLVRITYVAELEVVDGRIRLAYPTVVAPRYATATATDPLTALRDAGALNPPHLLEVPYGLSLKTEIDLGRPVKSVQSPSHEITIGMHDGKQCVTLAAGLTETDREIVLDLELGQEQEPRAESALGPDQRAYVAVTFLPEWDETEEPEPSEVVFVVDCSGSMQGKSIEQAKMALELCVRHLSEGDTFNICCFGSTFEWMSPRPVAYSQKTLDRAIAYVRGITAGLGGTEMYAPLESFVKDKPRRGAVRQVILLSDGQVSNEPAIIELATTHRRHNRFFTFGIGPASSRHLIRGLAESTRGAAEFIAYGERIEDKVLRTFSRLASPLLTDVCMHWDGVQVDQAPPELPPVFNGDALTVYARCAGPRVPSRVTLRCVTRSGDQTWTVDIPRPEAHRPVLPLLWARRMMSVLEQAGQQDDQAAQQLVDLSKQFGIMCSRTHFIAVEHRSPEERNNGQPATRRIPVQIPRGWHGIERAPSPVRYRMAFECMQAMSPFRQAPARPASTRKLAMDYLSGIPRNLLSRLSGSGGPADREVEPAAPAAEPSALLRLLRTQQADGSFGPSDDRDLKGWSEVRKMAEGWLAASGGTGRRTEAVLCTLTAVLLLHRRFGGDQPIWYRAERKAMRYLAKALGLEPDAIRTAVEQLASGR